MYADNKKNNKTIVLLAPYFADKKNLPFFYQQAIDLINIKDKDNLLDSTSYGGTLALDFTRAEKGIIFTGEEIDDIILKRQVKAEIEEVKNPQHWTPNPLYIESQGLNYSPVGDNKSKPQNKDDLHLYAGGQRLTRALSKTAYKAHIDNLVGNYSQMLADGGVMTALSFSQCGAEVSAFTFYESQHTGTFSILQENTLGFTGTACIAAKNLNAENNNVIDLFEGGKITSDFVLSQINCLPQKVEIENPFLALALFRGYPTEDELTFLEIFTTAREEASSRDPKAIVTKGREITDRLRTEINQVLDKGQSLLKFDSKIFQEIKHFNLIHKKIKHAENEAYSALESFKKASLQHATFKTNDYIEAAEKYIEAFVQSANQSFLKPLTNDPAFCKPSATVNSPLLTSRNKKTFTLPRALQEAEEQLEQFKLTTELLTRGISSKNDHGLSIDPDIYHHDLETRINAHKATVKSKRASKIVKGCLIAAAVIGTVLLVGLLANPIGFSILAATAIGLTAASIGVTSMAFAFFKENPVETASQDLFKAAIQMSYDSARPT